MNRSRLLLAMTPVLVLCLFCPKRTLAQNLPIRIDQGIPVSEIDTTRIEPQIDARYIFHPARPENPLAPRRIGIDNGLKAGKIGDYHRGNTGPLWPAISATGWTPPDPTLAVGPNHVVATVNSSIAFFTKAGVNQFQQTSTTFFSGMGATSFQFDPKCFYDRIHQRFVVIFDEESDSPQISKILLAVSDDADPNGTWYRYRLEAKLVQGPTAFWLDYPGWGYNKDAFVITGNMFGFTGGFAGAQFMVIPSAPLLSGGAATVNYFLDSGAGSVQVCEMIDPSVDKIYAVSADTTTSFLIHAITNLTGVPAITSGTVPVPAFSTPGRDAFSTSSRTLDSLDGRVYNACWLNGHLVTSHCIQNGNLRVRWYQFGVPNTWPTSGALSLIQSGDLSSATSDYHMSGISENSAGDVSVIFTRSSTTIAADIMYAGRTAVDPLGTMGVPNLLESSAGTNYTQGRWGDYFKVDVDPNDDMTFWGIGMDINAVNNWRTSVFSWSFTPQAPAAPTGLTATSGDTKVILNWNASPGATSYNVKRASMTGGPYTTITNVSMTTFTDTGLTNGTPLFYVVTALNAVGESGNSNEATATPSAVPNLISCTVNPTAVTGGGSSTGTVTVDFAPAADTVVNLSSSNAAATVPATATIIHGQTTANFNINTVAVGADTPVTISATLGAATKMATLTVLTARNITILSLSPTSVYGGKTSKGTVTISPAAPAAGSVVILSSNRAQATVPASVTVLSGMTQATFTVNTVPVASAVTATISATLGVTKTKSLLIKIPAISKVSFSPTSVWGGFPSTGTVTLTGATAVDTVVTLSSSAAEATVPTSVTVLAGHSTATFTANTVVVYANVIASVTGTLNGVSKIGNLTVKSNLVSSVSLTPTTVIGGGSSAGKVTLSSAAGPGGVIVMLSSDKPDATVPLSVTVLANQKTANFTVNTTAVGAQVLATISGSVGASTRSKILTINP